MFKTSAVILGTMLVVASVLVGQDAPAPAKPTDRVLGEITSADMASKKITVKEDATGTVYVISLSGTKTFLKVPPGEKDLKKASRIEPTQLEVGDRVAIRGRKPEGTTGAIDAASVLVMTASDLQQKHQTELADWKQRGTAGLVTAVDAPAQRLTLAARTSMGPKVYAVDLSKVVEFTRFSPDSPSSPAVSKVSDIQTGDQVRVLGTKNDESSEIAAERVYSGSFKTVSGTISAISPDRKELTVVDLQSKQPMKVVLADAASIRKLPPEVAAMFAARANAPSAPGGNGAGGTPPAGNAPRPPGGSGPRRSGDLSQLIESVPKISSADLKAGDAVVISGSPSADRSHLLATTVVAGVEPLFRSAPAGSAGGRSSGGNSDWNLGVSIPEQ